MRNFHFKAFAWGIMPLFTASLHSDDLEQSQAPSTEMVAYNEDAEIAARLTKREPARKTQRDENFYYPPYPQMAPWTTQTSWVDFLYLQAMEDNLEPAAVKASIITIGFAGLNQGTVLPMNFDYKPAFEVGTGVNFAHKDIDLWVEYFRYASTNITSASGNQYYPMQLEPAVLLAFIYNTNIAGGVIGSAAPFFLIKHGTSE